MDCLAICESGNFALKLCDKLDKKGFYCEVASTPCKLAKEGCSYCIKFSNSIYDDVIATAKEAGIKIVMTYKIEKGLTSNNYIAIN